MQFNSIRAKLTVSIVLTMLISVSILGLVNYWSTKAMLFSDMEENLASLAEHNADKLGLWLDMRKSELAVLANSPSVANGNRDTAINYLKGENKRNSVYAFFFVIDLSGNADLTTGAKTNVADRPYFQQAKSGKIVISNPVLSKVDGKPVVVVAAPIIKNEKIIGVLAATVTLGDMIKIVGKIKAGDTGYAYVVQNDGLFIFHPSADFAMKLNPLKDTGVEESLRAITGKMVKGEKGVSKYTFKGVEKYAAYAPIAGTTWSLAVNVPANELESKLNMLLWVTLIILLIVLAVAVISSLVIATNFTRPLKQGVDVAEAIARGDLTQRIELNRKDEIGQLLTAMRNMTENLKVMVSGIRQTAERVASGSQQLSTSSGDITRTMNDQSSRSSQIATSAEEMSQTVIDIKKSSVDIAASANDTAQIAQKGAEVVNKSVNESRAIAGTVESSAKVMKNLGDKSQQIGEIVTTINDIADQTNLLALNAAIEAARAGEQGRGFAVVADEVRKLAERTAHATSEISSMIAAIREEVDNAVVAMDKTNEQVEVGLQYSVEAGNQLTTILQSVTTLQGMVQQIASATEEMSSTSVAISGDIQQIATDAREISGGSEQVAQSSSELARLAGELKVIVDRFKV
jgi:methyl-accepting chemotaxis protein